MREAKIDLDLFDLFRPESPKDIQEGNVVFIVGDDEFLYERQIAEVIKPSSTFKAFCATDGCRYGLQDLYVLKNNNELQIEIKNLKDALVQINNVSNFVLNGKL